MRTTAIKVGNGKTIQFVPINSRNVALKSNTIAEEIFDEEDNLIELIYPDYIVTIGSQILLGKEHFKILGLKKKENSIYLLTSGELSKASKFLMPILGYDKNYFLWNKQFVNCYIDVEDIKYKFGANSLYLLYRYSKSKAFTEFEEKIIKHNDFIKYFDIDKYHVLYVFNFPDFMDNHFNLFHNGRYSKFRDEFKNQIMDFHKVGRTSNLELVFSKSEKKRTKMEKELLTTIPKGSELYSKPKMQIETFWSKYKISNPLAPFEKSEQD